MITALLIDDDSNLRNGMKTLLSRYAPDIKIVGESSELINSETLKETINEFINKLNNIKI